MSLRLLVAHKTSVLWIAAVLLLGGLVVTGWRVYVHVRRTLETTAVESEERARANGKYDQLLRRIRVPQDRANYRNFAESGYSHCPNYAGFSNLPAGFWVYAYPYWFIWGECTQPQTMPSSPMMLTWSMTTTPPQAPPLEEALETARVGGKYRMLLHQIHVPQDFRSYPGRYQDYGQSETAEYGGQKELSGGYWVYVYPYWYIWRDLAAAPPAGRPGGPEQAVGAPDTANAGPFETAWKARTRSRGEDWLLLEYDHPVLPGTVRIHETQHPGAVKRVCVFGLDGEEVEAWNHANPSISTGAQGISEIPIQLDLLTNRVKLYFGLQQEGQATAIDAVGLVDAEGQTHWAVAAEDGSTPFRRRTVGQPIPVAPEERIARLEEEVRQLRAAVAELTERLKNKH